MNLVRLVLRWAYMYSFLLSSFSVQAVYLDSTIYEMQPDESFISKKIYNDSFTRNIYNISVKKIDKPGVSGENRSDVAEGELLFAPLKFTLEPKASDFFKIFYRGPQDDTERYYRVLFREIPITMYTEPNQLKGSQVIPEVAIDTILVVRPRKVVLDYTIDDTNGTLKNTGNTYFKFILYHGCNSTDDEATIRYVLPGEIWRTKKLMDKNKKFIVALRKYIPIGGDCFD